MIALARPCMLVTTLIVALALFAGACGGGDDDDETTDAVASEDEEREDPPVEATEAEEPGETETSEPTPEGDAGSTGDGLVLLEDDFSSSDSGFPEDNVDLAITQYTGDDQYGIQVKEMESSYGAFFTFDESYESLRVEVDVEQLEGSPDQAYAGPTCRTGDEDLYGFYIEADGAFNIEKVVGGEPEYLLPAQEDGGEKSDAINAEGSNRVTADCVGSVGGGARLLMYVNNELIADVVDDAADALADFNSGGFTLVSFQEAPVAAVYDNLVITTFDEGAKDGGSDDGITQEAAEYLDQSSIALRGVRQDRPECFEDGGGGAAWQDAYEELRSDVGSVATPAQCQALQDFTLDIIYEAIASDPATLIILIDGKDMVEGFDEALSECDGSA